MIQENIALIKGNLKFRRQGLSKKFNKKDPHAAREAKQYDNPIVSRELIMELLESREVLMTRQEIATEFHIEDVDQKEALRRRLRAMERDGQLLCDHKGGYGLLRDLEIIEGRVSSRKDGSGWVTAATGAEIYLEHKQMRKVFPGDEVSVKITGYFRRRKTLEGKIEKVLKRHTHTLVGRFRVESEVAYLKPENSSIKHNILIPPGQTIQAKEGDYVLADIVTQPTSHTQAVGKVVKIMGGDFSCAMAIDLAIQAHHLPHEWNDAIDSEVLQLPDEVTESDLDGRWDLRDLPFVTIDGEDARDFDDAVYCRPNKIGGWTLFVAIADVSYYVRIGSAIDTEAQLRGNSVYFPNKVVPMLPEKLSNGLCSLKPKVDRLTVATEIEIDSSGNLVSYKFSPAVIHSHARLTYTKVADMLENDQSEFRTEYSNVVPDIEELNRLFGCLEKARAARGALEFDTIETRMIMNDEGEITEIVPVKRNIAHKIIEECMLMANVATAEFLLKHKADGVFRIHESPRDEKLEDLRGFLQLRGLTLKGGESPTSKDVSSLLRQVHDRPDFNVIQTVVLRTMNQAVYSPENAGHYGLGYEAYTHFTSPIRRYPDLIVHRVIRMILDKGDDAAEKYLAAHLVELSLQLSTTERRADEATRDVAGALKCSYMDKHVGDEFNGVISGVTNFGFFVTIEDLFVDGLVHVTSLKKEYYHFDEVQHALIGERTRKVFKLGDKVRVKVVGVKVNERKIDFGLV